MEIKIIKKMFTKIIIINSINIIFKTEWSTKILLIIEII